MTGDGWPSPDSGWPQVYVRGGWRVLVFAPMCAVAFTPDDRWRGLVVPAQPFGRRVEVTDRGRVVLRSWWPSWRSAYRGLLDVLDRVDAGGR